MLCLTLFMFQLNKQMFVQVYEKNQDLNPDFNSGVKTCSRFNSGFVACVCNGTYLDFF